METNDSLCDENFPNEIEKKNKNKHSEKPSNSKEEEKVPIRDKETKKDAEDIFPEDGTSHTSANLNGKEDDVEEEQQLENPDELDAKVIKGDSGFLFLNELKNYEFFTDVDKLFSIIDDTVKWEKHILQLCKTFENFIYSFSVKLLDPKYHLKRLGPKVFVCNAPTNRDLQLEALQDMAKKILSDESSFYLNDVIIRNNNVTDFIFDNNVVPKKDQSLLFEALDTISLSYKLLEKQQKQFSSLLIKTVEIDTAINNFFRDTAPLFHKLNDQSLTFDSIEFSKNLYKLSSTAEDKSSIIGSSSTLSKNFINNLETGIFSTYNAIKNTNERLVVLQNDSQTHDLNFVKELFQKLLLEIEEYLKSNFEIEPMNVSRGDELNFELCTIYIEPEKDPDLEDGLIKEIVNIGFKMNGQVIKKSDVIVVKN